MRKIIIFLLLLCMHYSARGQTQYEYRYWFDDDITTAGKGNATSDAWHMEVDLSHLTESFHTIHMQVADEKGVSSSPMTRSFFLSRDGKFLKKGFHWFDDETQVRSVESDLQGTLTFDVTELQEGYHTLHYQVLREDGQYSQIETRGFLKIQKGQTSGYLTFMCYVDGELFKMERILAENNQASMILDVSELPIGFHRLQVRGLTENGTSTSIRESFFLRNAMDSEINALSCIFSIDGQLYKTIENGVQNGVFHCDLDVASLSEGMHKISYYLTNGQGAQTAVKSQYFIKIPIGGNYIKKYQYWLNENDETAHMVNLGNATDPFLLISLLPVEQQPVRSKLFHFEVKDGQPKLYAKNSFHIRFFDAANRYSDATEDYIDYNVSQELTDVGELLSGVRETIDFPAENTIKWYKLDAERGDSLRFHTDKACTIQLFAPSGTEVYNVSGSESVKWGGLHAKETGTYYLAIHDVTAIYGTTLTIDYSHINKYAVLRQDVATVGNGGYSTITFEGNGFDDLYDVYVVNEKKDTIRCEHIGHEDNSTTSVLLNFNKAPTGPYKTVFCFTEKKIIRYPSISVKEATDIRLSFDIFAPGRYLINREATYYIYLHNWGNMTAYRVPLFANIITNSVEGVMHIDVDGLNLPSLYELANKDSLNVDELNELKEYSDDLGAAHYFTNMEDIDENGDTIILRNGYFYVDIPPYSTKQIVVRITGKETLYSWFSMPHIWNPTKNSNLYSEKHLSPLKGHSYSCSIDRVDCTVGVITTLASFFPGYGCISSGISLVSSSMHGTSDGLSVLGAVVSCIPGGSIYQQAFRQGFSTTISFLETYRSCTRWHKHKDDCDWDWDLVIPIPVKSLDPNDIYGYEAKSGSRFVADSITALNYRIEFENDTTFATAAAHVVEVKDTLDRNVFDLTSYAPTSIKIGDKTEYLDGSPEFILTVDMRPAINAIAQVEGKFDEQKGIATWLFTSLDPMTMEPTDDVMQGFLPVNYDGISGIGEVSFNISRKAGLPDGTSIKNRANIVFDTNDAILTPTWTNIVDAVAPRSIVDGLTLLSDSTLRVFADGEDARSGVWKYEWYVRHGENAPWWKEGETYEDCFDFHFYEGFDYGFCVIATDSAGNVERKELQAERLFKTYGEEFEEAVSLGPIPASPVGDSRIYDLQGRRHDEPQENQVNIIDKKKVFFRRKGK